MSAIALNGNLPSNPRISGFDPKAKSDIGDRPEPIVAHGLARFAIVARSPQLSSTPRTAEKIALRANLIRALKKSLGLIGWN